jgi:DNA-binding NarL/FixJ family response regulator
MPTNLLNGLTPAERMVAVHLAEGLSNKEISSVLSKAEATIKHQVSSILDKTGSPGRGRFIASYYQQFLCLLPGTFGSAELRSRTRHIA